MKHVPVAVLTVLTVPGILVPCGQLDLSCHNHYLLAGLAAVALAYKTANVAVTVGVSMGLMVLLRSLYGG